MRMPLTPWARRLLALLLLAAGLASNLASNLAYADLCDDNPTPVLTLEGNVQTGAATAPLGQPVALLVQCRGSRQGTLQPLTDKEVVWVVASGGGLVNGTSTWRSRSSYLDGRSRVLWQLGPQVGEQLVTATVGTATATFRAQAGGPANGGTCRGGAGTDLAPDREILGTETWVPAGSPYRGGQVVVGPGGVLVIPAGTTACLEVLRVDRGGRLEVAGTADQPVRMLAGGLAPRGWQLDVGDRNAVFFPNPAPEPTPQLSTVRHAELGELLQLSVSGRLLAEDTRFSAWATNLNACAKVLWTVGSFGVAAEGTGLRRAVFSGFGGPGRCEPGMSLLAVSQPSTGPVPFELRVLASAGDAVSVTGDPAGPAFAFQNCEISGTAGTALRVQSSAARTPLSVSGCNLTGNRGAAAQNLNPAGSTLDARGNWWGAPQGPPTSGANGITAGVDAGNPAAAPFALGY